MGQVSAPYSKMLKTHASYTLTLVRTDRWWFLQTRLVRRPKVVADFPSLVDNSASIVVFRVMVDPRYVNRSTSSRGVLLMVKVCEFAAWDRVTVFFRLIVSPNHSHDSEKQSRSSCSCSGDEAHSAASSAYRSSLITCS